MGGPSTWQRKAAHRDAIGDVIPLPQLLNRSAERSVACFDPEVGVHNEDAGGCSATGMRARGRSTPNTQGLLADANVKAGLDQQPAKRCLTCVSDQNRG